jgi:hypothetical protein
MNAQTLDLRGRPLPVADKPVSSPLGHAPLRRPGSVRRTSSIEAIRNPDEAGTAWFHGRARDVLTPLTGGAPITLAEDSMTLLMRERQVIGASGDPTRGDFAKLVGANAGGQLRAALDDAMPAESRNGTPLYLLFDDVGGSSLVGGWIMRGGSSAENRPPTAMEGVCIGLRPGTSALVGPDRPTPNISFVPALQHPDDPDGWHPLIDRDYPNFRRARRIDVWREGDHILIDSMFQDSGALQPDAGRIAIHEYQLRAEADIETMTLRAVSAVPGTLPWAECPAAIVNIDVLVGCPLADLRQEVLNRLKKTAGCTHLNDALRALAEVPVLASSLPA